MSLRLILAPMLALLLASAAWGQCSPGTVTITADRDTTLYEDASGMLSNGAGNYLFAGRSSQGSDEIRRGMVFFDLAAVLDPGVTIASATLHMTLDQPADNGTHPVALHNVLLAWGEGTSLAGGGEGAGATVTNFDATWLHTFFDVATWTNAGGDFTATPTAVIPVDAAVGGLYTWHTLRMASEAQGWLEDPLINCGWLLKGTEDASGTALRFATRENTGNEPTLCLEICPGQTDCTTFADGFESGDTLAWSSSSP